MPSNLPTSMRGPKFRAILEDLGLLVLTDSNTLRGQFVRRADASPLGFYDLHDDGAFRHGWVELPRSAGRTDATSWPDFYRLLQTATTR